MPTVSSDKAAALVRLKLYVQHNVPPVLDETTELLPLLTERQMATYWAAATVYKVGDYVLPTTGNAHRYRCVRAGTSSTVQPDWPEYDAARVGDGTVTWEEAGPSLDNVFDIQGAIYAAWGIKAAKASALFSTDHSMQQVFDHCVATQRRFRSVRVA